MKKFIPAILIALGLLALGLCVRSGLCSINDKNRIVSVRGLSERQVKADKVTWPIVYKLVGNDLQVLYNNIETTNAEVKAFLIGNGVPEAEITCNAPDLTDLDADRYNSQPVQNRYIVSEVIVVTSDNVDLVSSLIQRQGELLKKGISLSIGEYNYPTIYEFTDLNSIKPEMIADATIKAREAANKFADDSGSKIGGIKNATQGQFSIEDRDPYTSLYKTVRVVTYVDFYIE